MKSLILKEINRFTVILIYMFGIYVILHGHLSPGGGFAGGTILSAGMILYKCVYPDRCKELFSFDLIKKWMCGALFIYGSSKGYHILTGVLSDGHHGAKHIANYSIANAGSIVLLNVCVGIIVAGTFYVLVSLFWDGEL